MLSERKFEFPHEAAPERIDQQHESSRRYGCEVQRRRWAWCSELGAERRQECEPDYPEADGNQVVGIVGRRPANPGDLERLTYSSRALKLNVRLATMIPPG
jgi:hypothetical protein